MDISVLKNKRARLTIDFDGEKINAEILPHKLTPEYQAHLIKQAKEQPEDEAGHELTAKMLSELLAGWDVTAGDEPFPPTLENLRSVPVALIVVLSQGITDYVGKLAERNG